MSEPPEDRRKTPRVKTTSANLSAKSLLGPGKSAAECVVSVGDFSRGGASIYSTLKATPATPIRIRVDGISDGWIDGVVAWCMPVDANDPDAPLGCTYRLGIDFRPKDNAAQANLAATFEHISKLIDDADDLDDE